MRTKWADAALVDASLAHTCAPCVDSFTTAAMFTSSFPYCSNAATIASAALMPVALSLVTATHVGPAPLREQCAER
jgi:hypothetical protein